MKFYFQFTNYVESLPNHKRTFPRHRPLSFYGFMLLNMGKYLDIYIYIYISLRQIFQKKEKLIISDFYRFG